MSLFSVQARKHTTYYDLLVTPNRTPGRERPTERKATDITRVRSETTSGDTANEDSRVSDKSQPGNKTYVISAMSKSGSGQQTPYRGRLTLQRRSRRKTGTETSEKTSNESSQNSTPAPEKRLTLQRRTRTPSMDKSGYRQRGASGTGLQQTPKVLSEPNGRAPVLFRSMSTRETWNKSRGRETAAHVETQDKPTQVKTPSYPGRQLDDQAQTFKTPTKKTPFEKIAARRDVFERLASKEAPRPVAVTSTNLERSKSRAQHAESQPPVPAPRVSKASAGAQRPHVGLHSIKAPGSTQRGDVTQARVSTPASAPTPTEQALSRPSEALKRHDSFKMENSAVTVAVRVRPFNARFVLSCFSELVVMSYTLLHSEMSTGCLV